MKASHDLHGKCARALTILLLVTLSLITVLNINTTKVSAVESPYVKVVPEIIVDPSLIPGENFTVSIYTDYTGWDVAMYQFNLLYNPNVLNGLAVTNGDLITPDEHSIHFTMGPIPECSAWFLPGPFDNTAGELSLTLGLFKEKEIAAGPGTLANVTFTVVDRGAFNITIGSLTKLIGWDTFGDQEYVILDAAINATHIQHGYFDNRLEHDVRVVNVTARAEATVGSNVSINATVTNMGNSTEVANVTVGYDSTYVDSQNVTLLVGESKTVSFIWNTTGVAQGNYALNATANILDDGDPTDNWNTTTFLVAHDVRVVNVTAPVKAAVESLVPISVEGINEGTFAEVANVTVGYDSTYVDSQNVTLLVGESKTVSFIWNTTGVAQGNYALNATANILDDGDPTDNWNTTTILVVEHDVAVVSITAPPKEVAGEVAFINVTAMNVGAFEEVANVTVGYDSTYVDSQNVTLLVGESKTVSFIWNTTGVAQGNYALNATANILDDGDPTDNWNTTTISIVAHDVTTTDILVAPATAIPGELVSINVTVTNVGAFEEVANVTVGYDSTYVDSQNVTLLVGESKTVSFIWNTTGVAQGNYALNATANILDDGDPTDNWNTTTILVAMHDVAIKRIGELGLRYVGELVTVRVQVENPGWYTETFDLEVTYDNGVIGEPKSVTLDSGALEYEEFSWNTTIVAQGSYTIGAEAILEGDVNPTNNRKNQSITLELPRGAIAGTVTDSSTGDPIEGANVIANGYSDTTDANGHYNIADVPAGNYNVAASATGYESSSRTGVIVVAGGTTHQNFTLTTLPSTGTITGTVLDSSTGDPVADANVTANGMSATTNSSGAYVVSNVPAGNYNVAASATGYESSSRTGVIVVAGNTTQVDFELTPVQPTRAPNILLYAGVAAIAIVVIAGIAVYILKAKKRT